jgi:hypothetical protein
VAGLVAELGQRSSGNLDILEPAGQRQARAQDV